MTSPLEVSGPVQVWRINSTCIIEEGYSPQVEHSRKSKPSFLRRKINKDKSSMKVWCSLNCYYAGSGAKEAQTGSAGVYQTIKQSAINIYEIFRNLFSLNPAVM